MVWNSLDPTKHKASHASIYFGDMYIAEAAKRPAERI
jgi:hypothetical protein